MHGNAPEPGAELERHAHGSCSVAPRRDEATAQALRGDPTSTQPVHRAGSGPRNAFFPPSAPSDPHRTQIKPPAKTWHIACW
jgi:hypothetical protein